MRDIAPTDGTQPFHLPFSVRGPNQGFRNPRFPIRRPRLICARRCVRPSYRLVKVSRNGIKTLAIDLYVTGIGLRASVSVSETDSDPALHTPRKRCSKERRTVRGG